MTLLNKKLKSRATLRQRLLRNEDGNFALISAILMPVLLFVGLSAVDYGSAVQTDQKIKADAEAAVLAAVNETHIAYVADELGVDLKDLAEDTAREVFLARTGKMESEFDSLQIDASVRSNVFTVEIGYVLSQPSILRGMMDMESYVIGNSARARASATSYININLIFDVSGSMGIGATPEDQQIVADATGCAFACHTRGHGSYQRAHDAGAVLRIDAARTAATNAIASVRDDLTLDEQVTVGIHKFSNVTTEILAHDDPQSGDLDHVVNLLNTEITLDTQYTGTNMTRAMMDVMAEIPNGGSGRTPDDRIQYVVILSDGVENTQACTDSRCWYPHDSHLVNQPSMRHANHEINYAPSTVPCAAMRARDIHMYFINTEYIRPTTGGGLTGHNQRRFDFIEDTLHDLVDERMAECTGDEAQVVRANSPHEIDTAFEHILGEVTSPLRLF